MWRRRHGNFLFLSPQFFEVPLHCLAHAINLPLEIASPQVRTRVWPPRRPSQRAASPPRRGRHQATPFLSRLSDKAPCFCRVGCFCLFRGINHYVRSRMRFTPLPSVSAMTGRAVNNAALSVLTELRPYSLSWNRILMDVFHSQLEKKYTQVVLFVSECRSPYTSPPAKCSKVCYFCHNL